MAVKPKTPPGKSISQVNINQKTNLGEILEFNSLPLELVEPLEGLARMRGSLKRIWLQEHSREVIDYYTANGRVATMRRFRISNETTLENLIALDAVKREEEGNPDVIWGLLPGEHNSSGGGGRKIIKGSPIPPGWFVFKRGTIYDYIKPASEVAQLRGGEKMMWLREHGDEVEEYFYQFGEAAARNRFCLTGATLDAVLKGGRHQPFVNRYTRVDKLEMSFEAYRDDTQDLRGEVKELRHEFSQFQITVAQELMKKLLLPLLQGALHYEGNGDKKPKDNLTEIEQLLLSTKGLEERVK